MKLNIDERHSHVGFTVRHMALTNVRGEFDKVNSSLVVDDNGKLLSGEINIEVASINTKDKERDAHLLTSDFFDAAKFPTLTFRSTSVIPKGGDEYEVKGGVTMLGVTKPVTFSCTLTPPTKGVFGDTRSALELQGEIDRKDWGMKFNMILDNGGVLVGEKVKLYVEAEYIAE